MKLAAIDIGSNSIKMVVAEGGSTSFVVFARDKEVVRLGHDTLLNKHLSKDAIDRAAKAISKFKAKADSYGVERIVATATASVREADNAAEFINEIKGRTGIEIEILSGIEEARLIGLAASHNCSDSNGSTLNIDIGGGSTELSLMQNGTPSYLISLKLGAVGLTEQFITTDPIDPKELQALRKEIRSALERPARELAGTTWQQSTGTSGTILAIGEGIKSYGTPPANPGVTGPLRIYSNSYEINFKKLEEFNSRLVTLNSFERLYISGISTQRSEIIIAGSQILEGVMRALKIDRLKTCDWALREGVLIDRFKTLEAENQPPLPDKIDPRLRGVHAVGARFNYEEPHAHQVSFLAEKIFDDLAPVYKLRRHDRILLSAAALLHDIGYYIAHEAHHKHTQYLIKHSELTGFSELERLIISNIARYHRRSLPKEKHLDYSVLDNELRETVWRLGSILRIADSLDRGHNGAIHNVTTIVNGSSIHMHLYSPFSCDKEIEDAELRKAMFEKAFNSKLTFSTHPADI
jgi:exopolyphosphatase / guanosine-5'-triphosphate,3'-diphosphate pyrophosphatase